jgi:hypothetical protein
MAKKFKDKRAVFQLKAASFTQCQENFSESISVAEVVYSESSFILRFAAWRSSSVRNLQCDGVCGRKKIVKIPKSIVVAPSTKKMKGLKIWVSLSGIEMLQLHLPCVISGCLDL